MTERHGLWVAFRAAAALLCCAHAIATAQEAVDPKPERWQPASGEAWSIHWPAGQSKVLYQGVLNTDNAGIGSAQILYPAPHVAGLLVAILTHAALTEGAKSAQRSAMQAQADEVLAEFRSTIDGFEPADLLARARTALRGGQPSMRNDDTARWALEVLPLFRLTPDKRALMVDTIVAVRAAHSNDVVRRSAVRVVSHPKGEAQLGDWQRDRGEGLKQDSAVLLAQSIALSLADMAGRWDTSAAPQRTLRFPEGGEEKIERVQVLDQRCGRSIARTLRGDLMDVPLRPADVGSAAPCEPAGLADATTAPAAAREN